MVNLILINAIKKISESNATFEEVESTFSAKYFIDGIIQNFINQLIIHSLLMIVSLIILTEGYYTGFFYNLFLGTILGFLGYSLIISIHLRKNNLELKKIIEIFKITKLKDKNYKVYGNSPSIYKIMKKDMKKYAKIISESSNEGLNDMLRMHLFDLKNIKNKDLIYFEKKGYYKDIKKKYKKEFIEQFEKKLADSKNQVTTEKLTGF